MEEKLKEQIVEDYMEWCNEDIWNASSQKLKEYADNCLYGVNAGIIRDWIFNELLK